MLSHWLARRVAGQAWFGPLWACLAAAGGLAALAAWLPALGLSTVLLVGLLNYVPALALGPVVEHLMLHAH